MCAYVTDGGFIDFEFELEFDRETFTKMFGRTVTCEAIRLFRQHLPYFADGVDKPILIIAHLMVDGSAEQIKFLMMGAHGGCGECARLAMAHLEREDPAREGPRPFFLKFPAGTARGPHQNTDKASQGGTLRRRQLRGDEPPRAEEGLRGVRRLLPFAVALALACGRARRRRATRRGTRPG